MAPGRTEPCWLARQGRDQPDRPALRQGAWCFTFRELDARVAALAERLPRGDGPLALLGGPDWRMVAILLAALRRGRCVCPLNVRLPHALLCRQLAAVGARQLVLDRRSTATWPEGVAVIDAATLAARGGGGGGTACPRTGAWAPDAPATLVFTSGSLGSARAVRHRLGSHLASARAAVAALELVPGDRWLLSLPLYHVGGLAIVFRCLCAGATLALPEDARDPARELAAGGITHLSLVPTQLRRLLRDGGAAPALSRLKVLLLGGAPAPDGLVAEALARGVPVCKTYGMTEAASQIATVTPRTPSDKRLTCGRALSCCALRLSAGGELFVRGDNLLDGYVEDGRAVRATDAAGWLATGDLGTLDEEGYLCVGGRKDNQFISGGENIQPESIERVLCELGGVEEAIVVPIDDDEFGQRPLAFVRMAAPSGGTDELRARLRERLPGYAIPVAIHAWPLEAPAGIKVDRAALTRLARTLPRER